MCYASQQVIRKVFDYNAYIQGRLRGEYVVIYHTVVEKPEEIPADIQLCLTAVRVINTTPYAQDSTVIFNTRFKIKTFTIYNLTGTTIYNTAVDYYCYGRVNPIQFDKTIAANCRGAPQ